MVIKDLKDRDISLSFLFRNSKERREGSEIVTEVSEESLN